MRNSGRRPASCQRGEQGVARRERAVVAPQPAIVPFVINRVTDESLPIDIAPVPPLRLSGRSQRASSQVPRRRKPTPDREATICTLASSLSLRSLATDFGVSHETIRAVIRHARTVVGYMPSGNAGGL